MSKYNIYMWNEFLSHLNSNFVWQTHFLLFSRSISLFHLFLNLFAWNFDFILYLITIFVNISRYVIYIYCKSISAKFINKYVCVWSSIRRCFFFLPSFNEWFKDELFVFIYGWVRIYRILRLDLYTFVEFQTVGGQY